MGEDAVRELPLWNEFAKAAQEHGRSPLRILGEYMRECLEVWQDQSLDEEIRSEVSRTPYAEDDAVELVRRHRQAKAAAHDAA